MAGSALPHENMRNWLDKPMGWGNLSREKTATRQSPRRRRGRRVVPHSARNSLQQQASVT